MTAFGEKIKVFPPIAHCFADQFFTAAVAFACVNDIEPGIERALQQFLNRVW